MATLAEL